MNRDDIVYFILLHLCLTIAYIVVFFYRARISDTMYAQGMSIPAYSAPFEFHHPNNSLPLNSSHSAATVEDEDTASTDKRQNCDPRNKSLMGSNFHGSGIASEDLRNADADNRTLSCGMHGTSQYASERTETNEQIPLESRLIPAGDTGKIIDLGTTAAKLNDTSLPPAVVEPVMAPFEYIRCLPSKGIRDKLITALNTWIGASDQAVTVVKSITSQVHNLSLMLDDVQDNSPMRRSRPATHFVFGTAQTVNSATYQIVDVIARVEELGNKASMKAVIDEMKSLMVGQAHDLMWTYLASEPNIESYLRMVDGKTGGLFRMISKLMIAASESPAKPANLDRLMTLLGRFFQVRDDYSNLVSDQYAMAKGFAEDLDEGKRSFVLAHALTTENQTTRNLVKSILMHLRNTGQASHCQKEYIVQLLTQAGSFEFTKNALLSMHDDLEEEIGRIETSTGKKNLEVRAIVNGLRL